MHESNKRNLKECPSHDSTFNRAPRVLFGKNTMIYSKWYEIELILGMPFNK